MRFLTFFMLLGIFDIALSVREIGYRIGLLKSKEKEDSDLRKIRGPIVDVFQANQVIKILWSSIERNPFLPAFLVVLFWYLVGIVITEYKWHFFGLICLFFGSPLLLPIKIRRSLFPALIRLLIIGSLYKMHFGL